MFPLNFYEYIEMKRFLNKKISLSLNDELDLYIIEGGFRKALEFDLLEEKRVYLKNLIEEIKEKDIKRHAKVRNFSLFEKIITYIINNFGMTTNLNNLVEALEKDRVHLKRETLSRYIKLLKEAKVIYECKRFDLKSKNSLRSKEKYYLSDLSFYFACNTDNRINFGPALENVVYNYAASKGYDISVGKIGNLDCDFILRDYNMLYSYIQVSMTILSDQKTEDREYSSLEKNQR